MSKFLSRECEESDPEDLVEQMVLDVQDAYHIVPAHPSERRNLVAKTPALLLKQGGYGEAFLADLARSSPSKRPISAAMSSARDEKLPTTAW